MRGDGTCKKATAPMAVGAGACASLLLRTADLDRASLHVAFLCPAPARGVPPAQGLTLPNACGVEIERVLTAHSAAAAVASPPGGNLNGFLSLDIVPLQKLPDLVLLIAGPTLVLAGVPRRASSAKETETSGLTTQALEKGRRGPSPCHRQVMVFLTAMYAALVLL